MCEYMNTIETKPKLRKKKRKRIDRSSQTKKSQKQTEAKQETNKTEVIKTQQSRKRKEKQENNAIDAVRERGPTTTLMQDVRQLLLKIVVVCVAFALVFTFLFGVYRVKDDAMEPAVQDGDLVLYYRLDKRYVASDTLVLEYEGKKQIRRVVAVAGDVVDVTEEGVLINGSRIQEQGIYHDTLRYTDGVTFPITVGEGQVFVLGDNRINAVDGRLYGAVNIEDTFGKVMTILRRRNI